MIKSYFRTPRASKRAKELATLLVQAAQRSLKAPKATPRSVKFTVATAG